MELEQKNELKEKINNFPALQLPLGEREMTEAERMELIRLLMEYKQFDECIHKALKDVNKNLLSASDTVAWNTLNNKQARTSQFDGVAFMEAADSAMQHYKPDAGAQFLTYFDRLYSQRLVHVAQEQTHLVEGALFTKLDRASIKVLKEVTRLIGQTGRKPQEFSQECYRELASKVNISEADIRTLVLNLYNAKRSESLYRSDDDNESDEMQEIEFPTDCDGLAHDCADGSTVHGSTLERLGEIACVLDAFADADAKEFPRLFMSNDVLSPLKEIDSDTVNYARLLLQNESTFWQKIFVMDYLRYAFETPPDPDCVKHTIQAKLRYPLQDKTIAEYKQVSKGAVSQQRKKYAEMWQKYRKVADSI